MVDVVKQLCVKSFEITAKNGDHFKTQEGKTYTTTVPVENEQAVIVFSNYWVPVPKDCFVEAEA